MIEHHLNSQELEHLYSDAVTTIQSQMNFQNAVQQLEQAARLGHGKAALFLAELYTQGFRVERDSQKALYWQNLATMKA